MATKKLSRLTKALLEMADDQLRSGLMDKAEHEKITIRHLGQQAIGTVERRGRKNVTR